MSYPPVTVYTRTVCKLCDRVKVQLHEGGVAFEIVNIDLPEFSEARTYVTEVLGAKSVPVIVAHEGTIIRGYRPEQIKRLIDAFRYFLPEDFTPNERTP